MVNRVSFCSLQTHLITNPSPLALSKAIKNEVEIEGMKQAHVSNTYALLTKREISIMGCTQKERGHFDQSNLINKEFITHLVKKRTFLAGSTREIPSGRKMGPSCRSVSQSKHMKRSEVTPLFIEGNTRQLRSKLINLWPCVSIKAIKYFKRLRCQFKKVKIYIYESYSRHNSKTGKNSI